MLVLALDVLHLLHMWLHLYLLLKKRSCEHVSRSTYTANIYHIISNEELTDENGPQKCKRPAIYWQCFVEYLKRLYCNRYRRGPVYFSHRRCACLNRYRHLRWLMEILATTSSLILPSQTCFTLPISESECHPLLSYPSLADMFVQCRPEVGLPWFSRSDVRLVCHQPGLLVPSIGPTTRRHCGPIWLTFGASVVGAYVHSIEVRAWSTHQNKSRAKLTRFLERGSFLYDNS